MKIVRGIVGQFMQKHCLMSHLHLRKVISFQQLSTNHNSMMIISEMCKIPSGVNHALFSSYIMYGLDTASIYIYTDVMNAVNITREKIKNKSTPR